MSAGGRWLRPPREPSLSAADVHVWRATLDVDAPTVRAHREVLSADEVERAEQFIFAVDRTRFIVGRGLLRLILSRYLGAEPRRLRFTYSAHGKPTLVTPRAVRALRFNLAHSDGLALYAVTAGCAIGVDVERIRAEVAVDQFARRVFSARESAALASMPAEQRLDAFFACWTRKEAYVKATGQGLSLPLDAFDVSLSPGEPAALLGVRGDPGAVGRWSLHALSPRAGYAAALALERPSVTLSCWQYEAG